MTGAERLSRLRQEVNLISVARDRLERAILDVGVLVQGSLIKRHLGTAAHRRKAPAYYLSRAEGGRTRLIYVPRDQVESVRQGAQAWRHFKSLLRQWEKINDRIRNLLWQVGQLRQERGDGTKSHSASPP